MYKVKSVRKTAMSEEKVCYPNGVEARTGDIVWSDEGRNVRKVVEVVATRGQCARWGVDECGIMLARHIGAFDLGGMLYIGRASFEEEGVEPVEPQYLREIEKMFHRLGESLGISIWGNPQYAYYPALNLDSHGRELWYLFFQPAADARNAPETERCFRYNHANGSFEEMSDPSLRTSLQGLPDPRGGGPA